MDLAKIFQQLYSGKDVIKKHLILFSLVGTLSLLVNEVLSYYGNSLFADMITVAPLGNLIELFFALAFCIQAYLLGYQYNLVNSVMNSGDIILPSFNNKNLCTFIKIIPIFLLWQFYFIITAYFVGKYTIITNNLLYYFIIGTLLLCITPFVFMIYAKFAKNFKYEKDVILPWEIFKYFDRGLVDIVVLGIKYAICTIIPIAFFIGYFDWVNTIQGQIGRLVSYLIGISSASYIFVIFKLVYAVAIANIVKEKFYLDEI